MFFFLILTYARIFLLVADIANLLYKFQFKKGFLGFLCCFKSYVIHLVGGGLVVCISYHSHFHTKCFEGYPETEQLLSAFSRV
jgi:hypothetical protein